MHTHSCAPPLKTAIFQYQCRDEIPDERIKRLDGVLSGLGIGTVDLLVCPELFQSGYWNADQIIRYTEPANGPFSVFSLQSSVRTLQTANCQLPTANC